MLESNILYFAEKDKNNRNFKGKRKLMHFMSVILFAVFLYFIHTYNVYMYVYFYKYTYVYIVFSSLKILYVAFFKNKDFNGPSTRE